MAQKILVSVCMIAFNQEPFIAQAIEGVLMQEGNFDIQLLISDDASTDKTGDIGQAYADKYPEKVFFCRNNINLGAIPNLYSTIRRASGSYIALCEGDDYWTDPDKLQTQVSFLQEHAAFNICFHKATVLMPDGRLVDDFITKSPGDQTDITDLIRVGNFIHTPTVVLRNNFVLPEWFSRCPIGDFPLYILAVKASKIKCINKVMAVYRYGVGSFSGSSSAKRRRDYFLSVYELAVNFPEKSVRQHFVWMLYKEFLIYIFIWLFLSDHNWKDLRLIIKKLLTFWRGR